MYIIKEKQNKDTLKKDTDINTLKVFDFNTF